MLVSGLLDVGSMSLPNYENVEKSKIWYSIDPPYFTAPIVHTAAILDFCSPIFVVFVFYLYIWKENTVFLGVDILVNNIVLSVPCKTLVINMLSCSDLFEQ